MASFPTGATAPLDLLTALSPGMAFFLDFDGTLAPIVVQPGDASLVPGALAILGRLQTMANGALALVSGRSIAELDDRVAPLRLPAAGQHGAERRDAMGGLHRVVADEALFRSLGDRLESAFAQTPGLLVERKPVGVAVHYRQAPKAREQVFAVIERLLEETDETVVMQPGKMVFELKTAGINKGRAVASFMAERPFKGRIPMMAGDDLTDEAAFETVNHLGGISIKIGNGPTQARHRAPDESSFVTWLGRIAETLVIDVRPVSPETT